MAEKGETERWYDDEGRCQSDMGIPYNPIPNPKPYEKGMPISLEFYYNTAAISLSTTPLA